MDEIGGIKIGNVKLDSNSLQSILIIQQALLYRETLFWISKKLQQVFKNNLHLNNYSKVGNIEMFNNGHSI